MEENKLVIEIKGLKVWTPEEKSWRGKIVKEETVLLDNEESLQNLNIVTNNCGTLHCAWPDTHLTGFLVSGCIKQGEFVAVIGPSGAGKTTFLVSLAGKCTIPHRGTVTINGTNVKDLQVVEIVPQFEVFLDSLSVIEHLVFMTEMKLGSSKSPTNRMFLDSLLQDLKLKPLINTPIFGLSGGERRLLSLATSLLSSPQVLIADEPTTGLDSYNAALVILTLKKLALSGKTVICSIHQPSCDLYKEFSSIMLMAEGKLLFHGSQDDYRDFFDSINLHCPLNYNPAEFYINAVSGSKRSYVENAMENYKTNYECRETSSRNLGHITTKRLTKRNWIKQVYLLLWRLSITIKKNVRDHIIQLFINIMISSLVIGTCYVGISGTTQRGVQDIRGFLWLITSELSFSLSYNALYVFEAELALFKREAHLYYCSAYLLARFLSCLPRCVIWTVTQILIVTIAVDLPNHLLTSLEFIAALVVAGVAAIAYGLGMAAVFTSSGIMGDVMPCADLPLFLMSGAFLRISSMPVWLHPIKYISHFYYAMDAVSNVYWRQIGDIVCPWNSTSVCIKDGASVLIENGYSNNFVLQDGLGLMFVTILWIIIGYIGLKREEKKGYVF